MLVRRRNGAFTPQLANPGRQGAHHALEQPVLTKAHDSPTQGCFKAARAQPADGASGFADDHSGEVFVIAGFSRRDIPGFSRQLRQLPTWQARNGPDTVARLGHQMQELQTLNFIIRVKAPVCPTAARLHSVVAPLPDANDVGRQTRHPSNDFY
jgi:hypothetical protein